MAKIHDTWCGSFSGSDIPMSTNRIWIDGCFDVMHFGHARFLLMARKMGTTIIVGVHSDEEIQAVKGPVVMPLQERVLLVASCRWVSEVVPCAPYRTQTSWLDHFGAHLAVHGDDVAFDYAGQDSLAEMKAVKRFSLIERFSGPGTISTTDLIDRMLHGHTDHHLPRNILTKANSKLLSNETIDVELVEASRMLEKINLFSSSDGSNEPIPVFEFIEEENPCAMMEICKGRAPLKEQRVIYVDGAFDLFTAGHIAFLEAVTRIEREQYAGLEPLLVVGIFDDTTASKCKEVDSPVMNMVERALLLLQCRYVSAIVLSAPLRLTRKFLSLLHPSGISSIYFGATTFGDLHDRDDRYVDLNGMNLTTAVNHHSFKDITTEAIKGRILEKRQAFQSRQQAKRSSHTLNAQRN